MNIHLQLLGAVSSATVFVDVIIVSVWRNQRLVSKQCFFFHRHVAFSNEQKKLKLK